MEAKIFDLGGADGLREGFLCPPKVPLALAVRERVHSATIRGCWRKPRKQA
jgi:hypothetical protein